MPTSGLRDIWYDHRDTWSLANSEAQRRTDRKRGYLWYFATPAPLALVFVVPCARLELQGVAQLVAGATIFTGLLFGLLTLVFNTVLTFRKDGKQLSGVHGLARVITDLRANILYSIVVSVGLTAILVVGAALTPSSQGLPWFWTPLLVYIFGHLVLTILTVLQRYRTAFNYLAR